MEQDRVYTRVDVLALGFEATCHDAQGIDYVWHGRFGLRVDTRDRTTTLITNPAKSPDGPWVATELGEKELAHLQPPPDDLGA